MSFDLGKLFLDWRRIVPNGVPNPNNDYHLVLLKEICLARGIDKDVVDNVILTLEQDDKVKWKDKDNKDRETSLDTIKQYASDIKKGDTDKNKKLAVTAAGLDDKASDKKEEPTDDSVAGDNVSTDTYAKKGLKSDNDNDIKDDSVDKKQSKEEIKKEKREKDDNLVDTQLRLKKGDEQDKGGAGTPESRTGETVTVWGGKKVKELMEGGKSYEDAREEVRQQLLEISK